MEEKRGLKEAGLGGSISGSDVPGMETKAGANAMPSTHSLRLGL